jgi:hypothetical protein
MAIIPFASTGSRSCLGCPPVANTVCFIGHISVSACTLARIAIGYNLHFQRHQVFGVILSQFIHFIVIH